jgi:hypothetical protein
MSKNTVFETVSCWEQFIERLLVIEGVRQLAPIEG